jgi:Tfp pilus assembly protein FimT
MKTNAGASLLELLVVVCIVLVVAGIGIPILWDALASVRELLALVNQTVPLARP